MFEHTKLIQDKAERHGVSAKFILSKVWELPAEPRTELEMYALIDLILADAFENEYEALYEGQIEDPEYRLLFEFGVA